MYNHTMQYYYGTYDDLGLSAPPKISPAGLEGIRSRVVARGPVKEEHRTYHILSDLSSRISHSSPPHHTPTLERLPAVGCPTTRSCQCEITKVPLPMPPTSRPPRLRMASSTFDLGSTWDSAPLTYLWIPSAIQKSRDSRPLPCSYAFCSQRYYYACSISE